MARPMPQQLIEAREWFDDTELENIANDYGAHTAENIRVLLAATERFFPREIDALVDAHKIHQYDAERVIVSLFGPVKP